MLQKSSLSMLSPILCNIKKPNRKKEMTLLHGKVARTLEMFDFGFFAFSDSCWRNISGTIFVVQTSLFLTKDNLIKSDVGNII